MKYFRPRPRQLFGKRAGAKTWRNPIRDATGARLHLNNWNERANSQRRKGNLDRMGSIEMSRSTFFDHFRPV